MDIEVGIDLLEFWDQFERENQNTVNSAYLMARDLILSLKKERDELRQQLEAIKQSSKRRAPCENLCEARAFEIEIRQLKAQIDKLSNHQKGDL